MEECLRQKSEFGTYKGCYLATCSGVAENIQDEVCNGVLVEVSCFPERSD